MMQTAVPVPPVVPGGCVFVPDAFDHLKDREFHAVDDGANILDLVHRHRPGGFGQPTICVFNGRAVLRKDWRRIRIKDGCVVQFITLPRGGGGGGGKNPLKTVLMLAVVVAAAWAAPQLAGTVAGTFGGAGAGFLGGGLIAKGLISGAIMLAGRVLINALIPAPEPSNPTADLGVASPQASPTYSLSSQGNTARINQPIPVIYGRHKVTFDLGAEAYFEYVDNEQFMHQLLIVGQGEYDLSEGLFIHDTPIGNFSEVEFKIVEPGQALTLIEGNVASSPEVAGQELKGPNQLVNGDDGWIGPFVANGAETKATQIGIDVIFPAGLAYIQDNGSLASKSATWRIERREIDDVGNPVGDWVEVAQDTFSAADRTAQRKTYNYAVPEGRYEIRAKRIDDKTTSTRDLHELRWDGLKAFLTSQADLTGITAIEVKMKATDNLSQRSSRLINGVVTRKLPVWDKAGQSWSAPQATRSIAWALADVARADYGGKLSDDRLPLDALADLDVLWASRGDSFNAVFDATTDVWDALSKTARAGRAVVYQQGGRIRIFRDGPVTAPKIMFGPRNIVKGSVKMEYMLPSEDTADAVTGTWFNEVTWRQAELTGKVDGSPEQNPADVALFGITNKAQAQRELDAMAADNYFRRVFLTFRTELEGMIPTYGDPAWITHDLPRWGMGGDVTAYDSVNAILTLSEPPKFQEGQTHYIGIRKRNGTMGDPLRCEPVAGKADQVRVLDPINQVIDTGGDRERSHVSFGTADNWGKLCRILSLRPRKNDQVEVLAVVDDDRVYVN